MLEGSLSSCIRPSIDRCCPLLIFLVFLLAVHQSNHLCCFEMLAHAETYFLLIMCSLYNLPVILDWCFGLCMQEPKHFSHLHSGPTFQSCGYCLYFQCLHLHNLKWHLAVTFSVIMHMLMYAQPWHVTEVVSCLLVASAAVECMFPSMNNVWSYDRNRMFECTVLRFIGAPNHTLV